MPDNPYPGAVALLNVLDTYILTAIWVLAIPVGGWAFVHALTCRPDAFTAAEKLTKPAWLAITGIGLALLVICRGPYAEGAFFWIAALCAELVYLVDVRPSLIEVQGGRR